jgi:hypothetical protein
MRMMMICRAVAMLARDLLRLGQKALGLARLRHVGPDAAGLRAEAVLVVGAHRRLRPRRRKIGRYSAMVPVKTQQSQGFAPYRGTRDPKAWCRARAPKQCADKGLPRNRPDRVPVSFILPSAFPALFALPAGNAARRDPCLTAHRKWTERARERHAHGVSPSLARATNMPPSCGS